MPEGLKLSEFATRCLLHKLVDAEGNVCYWRTAVGKDSGYIVVWPNGDDIHTYRYPPDVWGSPDEYYTGDA